MSTQNNNATPPAEKLKALQLAMDKIEKDHGKGTIMRGCRDPASSPGRWAMTRPV